MLSKICSKCKEEKDVVEFHKHSAKKDGRQGQCKKCIAEYNGTEKSKAHRQTDEGRFSSSKSHAKRRGIEFLFTLEEYTALITESERCYYCGRTEVESNNLSEFVRNYDGNDVKVLKMKIIMGRTAHRSKHFTIDRLDSFGPYTDDNCVCCCALCNELKGWGISSKSWKKIANDAINEITESCISAGFNKEA